VTSRSVSILLTVVLAIGVAGCAGQSEDGGGAPGAKSQGGTITLGAVLTMTGIGSYYGKHQLAAIQLAVKQVNDAGGIKGKQVKLVYEDARSSNTGALSALQKVLESRPAAIVGPVFGTEILAMQPVLDRANIPLVTISGTRDITKKGSPNIFRTSSTDGVIKVALVDYIVDTLKKTKVGLIITDDAWGFSGRDVITAQLKEHGLEPVGVETHAATDTNMTAQLKKLKDAGADVIVPQGYTPDTGIILKEIESLNLGIPAFVSTDGQMAAKLDITTGKDVDGLFAAGFIMPGDPYAQDPAVGEWATEFKDAQGFESSIYSLIQYDGVKALLAAMEQAGTEPAQVREGLKSVTYKGFNGEFHADSEGNMLSTCQIYRFDESKAGIWVESVTVPPEKQK
jgi:branched-chain amino acid transport system substrate-binding protein